MNIFELETLLKSKTEMSKVKYTKINILYKAIVRFEMNL